jgi:hypothetical protein
MNHVFHRIRPSAGPWRVRTLGVSVIASLSLLAACETAPSVFAPHEATELSLVSGTQRLVVVSPLVDTLTHLGQTRQLAVAVRTPGSSTPNVSWRSLNTGVATVTSTGQVRAVAAGVALITATSRGAADTARVVVRQVPATVVVRPGGTTLDPGRQLQFAAVVRDAGGNLISGAVVSWSSANTTVASVSPTGLVTAQGGGSTMVRAVAGSVTGSEEVKVSGAPLVVAPPTMSPPAQHHGERSPHWPHIRTMITDFRVHHQPAGVRAAEYDWTARHYDWVMGGRLSEYAPRNPTGTHLAYDLYLALTAERHHKAAEWFAAHGRNFEAAHLHGAEPRTAATRMKATIWGSERHLMNVGNADYREYIAQVIRGHVAQGFRGVFWDEHETHNINRARNSVEYAQWSDFQNAVVGMLQYQRQHGGGTIMVNTTEYTDEFMRRVIIAAGATHLEFWNNPQRRMDTRWPWVEELTKAGVVVQVVDALRDEDFDRIGANFSKGNSATPADRGRLFTLASFYMMQHEDVERTLYTNINHWNRPFSEVWVGAVGVNVGRPREARRRVSLGNDAVGQPAVVFFREFDNALIVVRSQAGWDATRYGDATAHPVALPGNDSWHPVDRHGRIGQPVTRLELRNGEGAILLKGSRMR